MNPMSPMEYDYIKEFSRKNGLSEVDAQHLITFLSIKGTGKAGQIESWLKIRNIGLEPPYTLPISPAFLDVYIRHLLTDLDFGPVDRILRFLRKRMVLKYLPKDRDLVLLDVGCGRQASLGWDIRKMCKAYIGIDRDLPELQIGSLNLLHGSIEERIPDFEEADVDVVTALAVIEHIEYPEDFVRECFRIIRPGGLLMITTPPPISAPVLNFLSKTGLINGDEIDEHKRYYSISSLRYLLIEAGFRVLLARKFLFGFNSFIVGLRV